MSITTCGRTRSGFDRWHVASVDCRATGWGTLNVILVRYSAHSDPLMQGPTAGSTWNRTSPRVTRPMI